MNTKDITVTVEREPRGPYETLFRGYLNAGEKVFFLGKVITNDEAIALEYFAKGVKKLYGIK